MFYKLMYKRSIQEYRGSYAAVIALFSVCIMMFSFVSISLESLLYFDNAVTIPRLMEDHTCDIRITNLPEAEAELFNAVSGVEVISLNGNLDFFVSDKNNFTAVYDQIEKIWKAEIISRFTGDWDHSPGIYKYYGEKPEDYIGSIVDYQDRRIVTRRLSYLLQAVLAFPGITAMSLIYSSYIEERKNDIRTLNAIGISKKQLIRLFSAECNIICLISMAFGVILGILAALLMFVGCSVVDLSQTNAVYPTFHIEPLSMLANLVISYLAVYITYTVGLKKILSIDASYTCADAFTVPGTHNAGMLYFKSDKRFCSFFTSVIRKRSSKKFRMQSVLTVYTVTLSVVCSIILNSIIAERINDFGLKVSTVAELFATGSILFMPSLFALVFGFAVTMLFTKRHAESYSHTIYILNSIGADNGAVLRCFKRYTIKRMIISICSGFILGFVGAAVIYRLMDYDFLINIWLLIIGNILLAVFYSLAYIIGIGKYYRPCCFNTLSLREEIL